MALKALFLNTSLKPSTSPSHTSALLDEAAYWYQEEGVETKEIRVADYTVLPGVEPDMGDKDEWPQLMEEVMAADILIIGTPIWIGEKSSVAKLVLERLSASSGEANDQGQAIYYNKVAGVVITGNEDGAQSAAKDILFALQDFGYTIPPNVNAYWVGEAGPGDSYMDTDRDNEFTKKNVKMTAYNTMHFARILKENPIPAKGNLVE
ncbi:flavodoxin family protein [Alkalicoccus daliensis]|uniref:Multimeric flavodoxin WrbA n=1 Tax=Alkalicoccus daliensis TaxID=745820 RepID=A0A1H0I0E1_9BACI|nr:flavodoxin family protein [Alkalicoccus daliensis]SDO24907.1 Multimeric flavodoxin WrbA [Alkalicoccus daliensis]